MNNDDRLKKITEVSNSFSLSVDEKNNLKEKIISQMRALELKQNREKSFRHVWAGQIFQPRLVPYYALVLFFVLSSSSVLAAAQVSLPGNPLYGIKTSFNEKVKGIFLVSLADKAQREIELVDRRLKETRNLALTERLTPNNREIIENQLEKHTDKIKSYIQVSQEEGRLSQVISLQSQLEVSLTVNERVLVSIEPVSQEVAPIVVKVRKELSDVVVAKSVLQDGLNIVKQDSDVSVYVIAQDRLEAAKLVTKETERLINLSQSEPDEIIIYQEQLSLIKQDLKIGQEFLDEKLYQKALQSFDQSFKDSSEIKFLIENSQAENINKIFIQNKTLQLGVPQPQNIGKSVEGQNNEVPSFGEIKGDVKGVNARSIKPVLVPQKLK